MGEERESEQLTTNRDCIHRRPAIIPYKLCCTQAMQYLIPSVLLLLIPKDKN
jgi:hypothetical protein